MMASILHYLRCQSEVMLNNGRPSAAFLTELLVSNANTRAISQPSWWRHQMETFCALLTRYEGYPPVDSPHKGQCRGGMIFCLICAWTNDWVNNRDAGDLRRHRADWYVTVVLVLDLIMPEWIHPDFTHLSGPVVWTEHPEKIGGQCDILYREAVSLDDCKDICLNTRTCRAFNRNVPERNCRFFSQSALETTDGIFDDRKSFSFFRTTIGKIIDVMKMLMDKDCIANISKVAAISVWNITMMS